MLAEPNVDEEAFVANVNDADEMMEWPPADRCCSGRQSARACRVWRGRASAVLSDQRADGRQRGTWEALKPRARRRLPNAMFSWKQ